MYQCKRLTTLLASAAVVAFSGAAFGLGQPEKDRPKDQPSMEKGPRDRMTRTLVFTSGKKINGASVKNSDNKSLGSIDDLVIDRGSGQIDYVVVKTGAILGMGGKDVAVPYHQMGWDNVSHVATLAATPDEIKTWPEFNRDQWKEGSRTETVKVISKRYYDGTDSPWPNEAKFDKTTTIKGKVKTITRRDIGSGREETILIVQSDKGGDQEVILGPSWYLSGNNSVAIFRDADIEADTFSVERTGRSVHMTRVVRVNGKDITFYDNQGRALWAPSNSTATTIEKSTTSYTCPMPQVLFTDLKGKNVLARGEKCGEIQDIIVECRSGKVAFIALDPDKNFLGIGDEQRLVPWTLLTSSCDNKAHIDANKTMLQNSQTVPKDLETLADGGLYQRVYTSYDVPAVRFETRREGDRRRSPKD